MSALDDVLYRLRKLTLSASQSRTHDFWYLFLTPSYVVLTCACIPNSDLWYSTASMNLWQELPPRIPYTPPVLPQDMWEPYEESAHLRGR
eukprot:2689280-Amphidinium_carterae.2